jgi:hypothetical protein
MKHEWMHARIVVSGKAGAGGSLASSADVQVWVGRINVLGKDKVSVV